MLPRWGGLPSGCRYWRNSNIPHRRPDPCLSHCPPEGWSCTSRSVRCRYPGRNGSFQSFRLPCRPYPPSRYASRRYRQSSSKRRQSYRACSLRLICSAHISFRSLRNSTNGCPRHLRTEPPHC